MTPENKPMDLEGVEIRTQFLSALALPDYARSDYFLQQAAKSGWSMRTYIRGLYRVHAQLYEEFGILNHMQSTRLYSRLKRGEITEKERKNAPAVTIDLAKKTNDKLSGTLDKEQLIDLEYALQQAWEKDLPKPELDSYDVLALNERALLFICDQFNRQIRNFHPASFAAAEQINDKENIPKMIHTVYHYSVIADGPFLDYQRYRKEMRKLLLHAANPEKLETMTKASRDVAIEIINIWNDRLHFIEHPGIDADHKVTREQVTVEVNMNELEVSYVTEIPDNKHKIGQGRHYWNYDLVKYASYVANLIGGEVMKSPVEKVKISEGSFVRDSGLLIVAIRERMTRVKVVVEKQQSSIERSLSEIESGVFSLQTARNLIPSIEGTIKEILIANGKLDAGDVTTTLQPMVEKFRALRGDEIILSKTTLDLIEMMPRNKVMHGNLNPDGSALEYMLHNILNVLSHLLQDIALL